MPILAGSIPCGAPIVGAALLAFGLTAVPGHAQIAASAESEQIIISNKPEQQSRVRKLVTRLLGRMKTEKLKITDSRSRLGAQR